MTFGAAIGACERGSLWQQSVYLLRRLRSERLEANVVVGSAAISACAKCGQWELALQMLADLLGRCILSEEMTQTTHPGTKEKSFPNFTMEDRQNGISCFALVSTLESH